MGCYEKKRVKKRQRLQREFLGSLNLVIQNE